MYKLKHNQIQITKVIHEAYFVEKFTKV